MTEAEIAAEVPCSQPTINRILNGKQKANYEVGKALERLAEARIEFDPTDRRIQDRRKAL